MTSEVATDESSLLPIVGDSPEDGDFKLDRREVLLKVLATVTQCSEDSALERAIIHESAWAEEEVPGSTFSVFVDRSSGVRLGVDVESCQQSPDWDGQTLLVKGVQQDGMIPNWNKIAPVSQAVRAGDRLVEANGVAGDAMALIRACQALAPLQLLVQRPLPELPRRFATEEEEVEQGEVVEQTDAEADASDSARNREAQEPSETAAQAGQGQEVEGQASLHAPQPEYVPVDEPPENQDIAATRARRKPLQQRRWVDAAPAWKLAELQDSIRSASSAAAVVWKARSALRNGGDWHSAWAAEALHRVSRKSTLRTRTQWAEDETVQVLAKRLQDAMTQGEVGTEVALLAMEALRRLQLQDLDSDLMPLLEKAISDFSASDWSSCNVKSIVRLFWLLVITRPKSSNSDATASSGTPSQQAIRRILPRELAKHVQDLDVVDSAMLLSALHQAPTPSSTLLQKVVARLRPAGVYVAAIASDMVEIAEAFAALGVKDDTALRVLGEEVIVRRAEHSPDELLRLSKAFERCGLPMQQVFKATGSAKRKRGGEIVTTQVFAAQVRHGKRVCNDANAREAHEHERASPPRYAADHVRSSF